MTMLSPFLTLDDVYDYLPNFDADCDLQVGDWVVVQPWRINSLLGPLIANWEQQSSGSESPSSCTFGGTPKYSLDQLLPEPMTLRRRSLSSNGASLQLPSSRLIRLAPLSMARAYYCQRKRRHILGRSASREDEAVSETADASSDVLYLHVRLGLLTPSRPYIFGGLDVVEVLAWPSEADSAEEDIVGDTLGDHRPATSPRPLFLNLLTGESLTKEEALCRVSASTPFTSPTSSWTSPIQEAAEREWQQWVAIRMRPQLQTQTCG